MSASLISEGYLADRPYVAIEAFSGCPSERVSLEAHLRRVRIEYNFLRHQAQGRQRKAVKCATAAMDQFFETAKVREHNFRRASLFAIRFANEEIMLFDAEWSRAPAGGHIGMLARPTPFGDIRPRIGCRLGQNLPICEDELGEYYGAHVQCTTEQLLGTTAIVRVLNEHISSQQYIEDEDLSTH